MTWERINRIGWRIERALAWAVFVALLAVLLMTLLRAEWALVPAAARTQILCSEVLLEHAAQSPLAFTGPERAHLDESLQHDMDRCEHAPPPAVMPLPMDLAPFE